ncbi:MAG: tRNA (N(6)-L-threonylcarbamoyladenosine(37)-C(2))-methylthiotransferase MtaB [Bauldia sp.]|nr:tRNA (N(6)-L-threonylcarbamoyladenosine(37)-C(2))-methylthiotransferase MtaB [Bauldia sp.]
MIDVVTFGCRLNALESEVMRARAAEAGLADAVLVNTCAVTAEAVRQARQAIRRTRRDAPGRPIVVAGCAAQTDAAGFAAMPEVDLVLGNAEKLRAESYRAVAKGDVRVADIMAQHAAIPTHAGGMTGRSRAFVEIQNGCDHRCTFCIIPYARGNSRSVAVEAVVAQARHLVATGRAEIVLTGVDITAWGTDLPGKPALGDLVAAVLRAVPALRRLRLSSVDAAELDDRLLRLFGEDERLMPHLHLSLQSGDDLILKRMRRRHGRRDAIDLAARLRRHRADIVLGADLIAGFPTETEAMFQRSLSLIDDCGLTYLHVFPYSDRPGTPAARMPQLPHDVVRERAARLRDRGDAVLASYLAAERGRVRRVLVERGGHGHTEHFAPVSELAAKAGEIVAVRITGSDGRRLTAAPLAEAA